MRNDDFHFNRVERRSLLITFGLIFLIMLVMRWTRPEPKFTATDFRTIDSLIVLMDSVKLAKARERDLRKQQWKKRKYTKPNKSNKQVRKPFNDKYKPSARFIFDPNTLSYDSLILLGFSKYAANNLVKYRSKGGRIHKATELQKVYGVDSSFFSSVKELIYINNASTAEASQIDKKRTNQKTEAKDEIEVFDINDASMDQLLSIKGIGDFYANQIIEYREKLGGFHSLDQLFDLYKMDDERYDQMSFYLSVSQDYIDKIDINAATVERLAQHPYVGWRIAKQIIKYRDQHGDFVATDDLLRIYSITDSTYTRILPYITTE